LPGSEHPKKSIRFQERTDLGGPQRFLVTVMEAADLRANSGKLYVRAVQGTTGQETRRYVIGDRLVQGIVKVWAGHVKIGEEFYFEVSDPDTYIYLQVRIEAGKGDTKTDVPIGKEVRRAVLCRVFFAALSRATSGVLRAGQHGSFFAALREEKDGR